ncbi:MAG: helix-turn-helix domain-containing protein [Cyanobacteria bacterium SZAS LIN-2]|nr:helix-turn-helix domain-containing protein [Cyanobacteria bacterium SZAS LIN-2]
MTGLKNNDKQTYDKLIRICPLRPIRDDEQYEIAGKMCDQLTARIDHLNQAERDYLEVITDLILKYESKWDHEAQSSSPRDLIRYLMQENGLSQKDLVPEFGTPSRVSEFLKGERRLSLEQAKKLAARFRLNIAALVADPT